MKKSILFLILLITASACAQGKTEKENKTTEKKFSTITLGGGCYWCVEALYEDLIGVKSVVAGFAGGQTANPTYEEVCTGTTGHAEVVQIKYDESKISLEEILKVFFTVHDPTTLNRQGADIGTQYRSIILYSNATQKKTAENIITELTKAKAFQNAITTQVVPLTKFYIAEDYHQDYFKNNPNQPYCRMVIQPKMDKFEKIFKDKIKKD
ncbi:peptide-methionine (S)-S-oxide reductase MsrA [Flavobacterium agrisoli]|uniref:Peptide methionine sulfoxide reductase MsrA n=1 Tax=Flavobacterium agrisoli TaxID=2793066 RepID=A0A934PM75_9FLAO|nr:peptide-methionine (S)-S-oxide reductase MsrA [Flavobacterium agrisoli]MBK0370767.1 peptide-methionine (S)-S-oxide reductase MsrA [Flavobacterium agrisoli]